MRAIIMTALLLLRATTAEAADKPVPWRVCLTQQQAAQVYKGKKVKYRLIKDDQGRMEACWYAGKTLPKFAFHFSEQRENVLSQREGQSSSRAASGASQATAHTTGVTVGRDRQPIPRATGVAARPTRPITQDTARVQVAPFGSIPDAGYFAYSEEDRDSGLAGVLDALCGGPCVQMQTFEQRWRLR